MFQHPRDAKQNELFGIALKGEVCISNLYSHPNCWLLKSTQLPVGYPAGFTFPPDKHANRATYEGRGWCFCESSVGNLVKNSLYVLDLGLFSGTKKKFADPYGDDVTRECRAVRSAPLAPPAFDAILETKSFTSKNADLDKVKALYAGAFEQRIGQAVELTFSGLRWGDAEVKVLCQALHAAKALLSLNLGYNAIEAEGMAALAACLREGAAPKLERLVLWGNPGPSEAAKKALEEAREGLDVKVNM